MSLGAVHRWHWMVLSLIVGGLLGYSRQQSEQDLQYSFGNSITGQRNFEDLLSASVQGRHPFDNLKVHKQQVSDGKGGFKPVHVVTGTAFLGDYEVEGGKQVAHWRPTFFVAPIPYKPRMNVSVLNVRGGPDFAAQFRAIKEPTVVDFLTVLGKARGITFRHAWWYELNIGWWVLASFVVLGLILPTILNLMLFGSWRRPPQQKGVKLTGVQAHSTRAESPAADRDAIRLAELEEQLAQSPPGVQTTVADIPAPVRELDAEPLAPVVAGSEQHAEFGAKRDDFYPTEVHLPHPPKES